MSNDSSDSIIPLSRFRAALARPRGYKRVEELIYADDPAAAVGGMSVTELYFLIKEVGFGDSYELISLATPEQIRGCLDLDIWDRDKVQLEAVAPWLTALADNGFEQFASVWEQLDPELTALIIKRWTVIYDLSLGEEPDDSDDLPMFTTPDTFFAVKLTAEKEDDVRLVYNLIEDLYRADGVLARHTLMSARSEVTAELEEMSYRWRTGRMADLGYVDFYQALEVFRPIDPRNIKIGEQTQQPHRVIDEEDQARAPGKLPATFIEHVVGRAFLARVLDRITDAEEAERLEAALLILVNNVLAAARVSPGDEDAVKVGTEHATATLALGLETISAGSEDQAEQALRTISLTRLHRLGYTVSLRLSRLARALAPRARTTSEPTISVLAALLASRPFFAQELDTPAMSGPRPFESLADIRVTAEHLTVLALRIAVADSLGVDLIEMAKLPEPRPSLDDHSRTALVRALVGGEFEATPLSVDELVEVRRKAFEGSSISASARSQAATALEVCLDKAEITSGRELLATLLSGWFIDIEQQLGGLDTDTDIDPRFVEGVILSHDKS